MVGLALLREMIGFHIHCNLERNIINQSLSRNRPPPSLAIELLHFESWVCKAVIVGFVAVVEETTMVFTVIPTVAVAAVAGLLAAVSGGLIQL